jgi:hypothetical protein
VGPTDQDSEHQGGIRPHRLHRRSGRQTCVGLTTMMDQTYNADFFAGQRAITSIRCWQSF